MKKRFYLVRHGEKVKMVGEPPLTQKGHKQAIKTAEYLNNKNIDIIFCSPIKRTIQTAKHLSYVLNLEILIDKLLRERVNWGDGPALPFEEFVEIWNKASVNRDWQPPIGDSSRTAGNRLKMLIENEKSNAKNIVLVTHGGIITDFLKNVFEDELLNVKYPNFTEKLDGIIHECSITEIDYDPVTGVFDLISIATTKHL